MQRIAELEAKVDHLIRHLTGAEGGPAVVPPPPAAGSGLSPAVRELAAKGDMIQAIKQYRAETGADLAAAKHAVENLRG